MTAAVPVDDSRPLVRRVFTDSAVYALGGAVSQGIAFLLFPLLARTLTPAQFGVLDLLTVMAVLVHMTVALEISQGFGRYFADAKTLDEQRAYASTALWFTAAAYAVFALAALALARPLTSALLADGTSPAVLRLAIGNAFVNGLLYLCQQPLRWQLRPRAYASVVILMAATTAAATAVLVVGFGLGVEGAVIGQLIGASVALVLCLRLVAGLLRPRFDRARCLQMLAFSLPLVPSSVGVFLNGWIDRIAIRSNLTLADVGVYGAGYRLSLVAGLLLLGFQGALLPLLLARQDDPRTPHDLARVFRLFCALALTVLIAVAVLSPELISVLAGPGYGRATEVVAPLLAGAFFAGMYVFAPGLAIRKRTRAFAAVSVSAGVANAALAFTLVPIFGIRGGAFGTLISSAAGFAALMALSQRLYPAPHDWRRLVTATAVAGVVVVVQLEGAPLAVRAALGLVAVAAVAALLIERSELALAYPPWRRARSA